MQCFLNLFHDIYIDFRIVQDDCQKSEIAKFKHNKQKIKFDVFKTLEKNISKNLIF